ncbi:MAG: ABC transporter permease [Chlamydiota bacterium]
MKHKHKCFLELIRREMYLFFKEFTSRIIDISIVLASNVLVFGYLMSKMGLNTSYGAFILVGAISSFGLFITISRATVLAQDANDKKISNFLILPISSSAVFISIAFSWALQTSILSLCLFPLGKLLLWNKFDLSHFSIIKFVLMFISTNLFYGFFALWIASFVTNLRDTSWLWCRVINPLFMFCGYYYSWQAVYELSPAIGTLHFLNPLLYVLEGTKAAILGQTGYLSFWICLFAVCSFGTLFACHAISRFKKQLDCV